MPQFTGTVADANRPIVQADALLKNKISINTTNLSIDQAAFKISTSYVASYKEAIENYITAVGNKHSLIEQGGYWLSEMQELKIYAESKKKSISMPDDMWNFMHKYGIKMDGHNNDRKHNSKEWQVNIEYLNNWIKGRSNNVETDVIKLNDIINKQNQLLQSATTIMKKAHEVLESLIRTLT